MRAIIKQRIGLGVIILITAVLWFMAADLNDKSFKDVSRIVYAVKASVGNLREGPSKGHTVIKKLEENAIFRIIDEDGKWFKGRHVFTEGWVHESILGKYLYLGYYEDYIVGKSMLELEWNN